MNTSLCRRGYVVRKDEIDEQDIIDIKRELTVSPYVPDGFPGGTIPSFKVYLESESSLFLPRHYGLTRFGPPKVNKLTKDVHDIDIEFKGTLRPEQDEPVAAFVKAANDPTKMGGILNLQCAAGKTVMAIYLICRMAKKTLVIVHKEFLIQQWKERIAEFAPSARVGILKAKVVDVEDKDIIIASLQSLSMKDYDGDTFQGIGMIVADECHHLGAEVFSRALQKVNSMYTLGLSATVKRKDGLSKVFMWHLGDIVFKRKSNIVDRINVDVYNYVDPFDDCEYSREYTLFGNKPNTAKMINNICEYKPRTEFIVKQLQKVLAEEPDRRILILSDRRGHLTDFKQALTQVCITDVGYYYGGMKEVDLKESEGRKVILGTFSMISEGFDVKGLDTLILASPKSDIVQSVGRILREKPENRKHVPLVIDVVDSFSMFPRQAHKRLDYYKKCKYIVRTDGKAPATVVSTKLMSFDDFAFKN